MAWLTAPVAGLIGAALGGGATAITSAITSDKKADLERETSLPGRARVPYSDAQLSLSKKLAQRFGDYGSSVDAARTPLGRFDIEYGRVGDLARRLQNRNPMG